MYPRDIYRPLCSRCVCLVQYDSHIANSTFYGICQKDARYLSDRQNLVDAIYFACCPMYGGIYLYKYNSMLE